MIGAIEEAIKGKIIAAMKSGRLGYSLTKVESYGGEFDEGLEKLVRDFPAVLIINSGLTHHSHSNARIKFSCKIGLICCAKNLRNEVAARQGSGDRVGSYQISMDMISLFGNQSLGLEIEPFIPQGMVALANNKSDKQLASIYAVELLTYFDIETADTDATLDDFATFHANWDVPVHGNVEPPLPADDKADATDHVTLETL